MRVGVGPAVLGGDGEGVEGAVGGGGGPVGLGAGGDQVRRTEGVVRGERGQPGNTLTQAMYKSCCCQGFCSIGYPMHRKNDILN